MSGKKTGKPTGKCSLLRRKAPALLAAAALALGAAFFLGRPRLLELPYCTAEHIAALDLDRGRMVYEKDADTPCPPASLTKLMSLAVVLDRIEEGALSWEDVRTVTEEDADTPGSKYGLIPGEEWTVRQLAAGALMNSGCDCVQALAALCADSREEFVRLMNEKAEALGLWGTRFANCAGLDDAEQYITARDAATLAGTIVEDYPTLLEFTSRAELEEGGRTFRNTNRLIGADERVLGLKTGTSSMGGCHLAVYARAEGKRYAVVLLDSADGNSRYREAEAVLDALFGGGGP